MRSGVGNKIREVRTSKGISCAHVAKKLGIHPSTLGKYESGVRKIDADLLPKIANALDVDVRVFFTHELDEMSNNKGKSANKAETA